MKTEQSIKNIVAAAVRRHGMEMDTWQHTRLWDEGDTQIKESLSRNSQLQADELPILYSYIDLTNWTLVTTRRIYYCAGGQTGSVAASDVVEHRGSNFKGYGGQEVERMIIRSKDGETHYCPFETGKASMGTIYAVRTLCQIGPAA